MKWFLIIGRSTVCKNVRMYQNLKHALLPRFAFLIEIFSKGHLKMESAIIVKRQLSNGQLYLTHKRFLIINRTYDWKLVKLWSSWSKQLDNHKVRLFKPQKGFKIRGVLIWKEGAQALVLSVNAWSKPPPHSTPLTCWNRLKWMINKNGCNQRLVLHKPTHFTEKNLRLKKW